MCYNNRGRGGGMEAAQQHQDGPGNQHRRSPCGNRGRRKSAQEVRAHRRHPQQEMGKDSLEMDW